MFYYYLSALSRRLVGFQKKTTVSGLEGVGERVVGIRAKGPVERIEIEIKLLTTLLVMTLYIYACVCARARVVGS